MAHTKEPYIYHTDPSPDGEMGYIYGQGNILVAEIERAQTGDATAKRIVACVNACASIPNPEAMPECMKILKVLLTVLSEKECSNFLPTIRTDIAEALKDAGIE